MSESLPAKYDYRVSSEQSVTEWLEQIKAGGNEAAAQKVWDRYIIRLVQVAAKRLKYSGTTGAQDEEDAVIVAFAEFLERAAKDGFSKLNDRNDLWQVLVMLTDRRAIDQIRRETTKKKTGQILGEPPLDRVGRPTATDIYDIPSPEPSPEYAQAAADELERLLRMLDSDENASPKKKAMASENKSIAIQKLKGYTVEEIAAELNMVTRTVENRLRAIREAWLNEFNDE